MATEIARPVVAMPWRPQPDRMAAYEFVRAWWDSVGISVVTADSDPDLPFQLSQARNDAVRNAQAYGNVVIVADADTIPEFDPVHRATLIAVEPGHVIYPFDEYRYITSAFLSHPQDPAFDYRSITPKWVKENSVGGILVTSPQTYWDLGGMDEKFERCWGFEDNAFVAVADTLAKVIRMKGKAYSFSHEVEGIGRDWTKLNPNWWRNELYQHCWGNQKLMRELIK